MQFLHLCMLSEFDYSDVVCKCLLGLNTAIRRLNLRCAATAFEMVAKRVRVAIVPQRSSGSQNRGCIGASIVYSLAFDAGKNHPS